MVYPLAMIHLCDNPEVIHEHPEDGQGVLYTVAAILMQVKHKDIIVEN